jgi:predicted  nucleic acid-binding Zn-ribbon protein
MELLYFIVGILSMAVLYAVIQVIITKNENIDLRLNIEDLSYNIEDYIQESLENLESRITSVQDKLEEDSYDNISGITKQLAELNKMTNAMNVRFGDGAKFTEKQLSAAFTEIQQLKTNIKALNQDPNLMR